MPRWVKMALIIMGTLLFLLIAAGIVGARVLKSTFDNFEKATAEAKVDGEVFGMTSTPDGCIEEAVRRSAGCKAPSLTCAPVASAFLWACLEGASGDPGFCEDVPSVENDRALLEWGGETCRKYGEPDNTFCPIAVAPTAAFCEHRGQVR
jgi:hypothetical protein